MSRTRRITRRVLIGGGVLAGAGSLAFGASVLTCATDQERFALSRPLFLALSDTVDPVAIGEGYINRVGEANLADEISKESRWGRALLIPQGTERRAYLTGEMRVDFATGNTIVLNRWVASSLEGLIAAAWVADGQPGLA